MKITNYIPKTVSLDLQQLELVKKLELLRNNLNRPKLLQLIKKNTYSGIYIYGAVGRGKTVIMKAFYESLRIKKNFYHYQAFIKYLHEQSHIMFVQKIKDPIITLAENLARLYKVIFIDELEVRDITDAMLIQRLCDELNKRGVFIAFTSNIKPTDLYKDGLQRELFFKFINFVENNFFIHYLDNAKDYRFSKISANKNIIIYPANDANKQNFKQIVYALIRNNLLTSDSITVFGREVIFKEHYEDILYSNSQEIFERELSYNDYLTIAKKYNVVIISSLAPLPPGSDAVIRFINFIDNIYANKVMLVGLFEVEPEKLYNGREYKQPFQRAISRIMEMNSAEYITSSKYYNKNEK